MIVTPPVLSVASAAKLSVAPSRVKSLDDPGSTARAETVTVKASAEAGATVAVTLPTPPSSPIESGVSTSVTSGAPSSSSIVTVCCVPIAMPSSVAPIRMVSSASAIPSSSPTSAAVAVEASTPVPAGSRTVVDSSR